MRQPDGSILRAKVRPSETAFENNLYSLDKVPQQHRQAVEKMFFATEVDDKAAAILPKLKAGAVTALTRDERVAWTRFLIAARLRVPEIVHDIKVGAAQELRRSLTEDHKEFLAVRGDADEKTLLDWTERNFVGLIDSFGMVILPNIINDPEHTRIIAAMQWWVEDLSEANVRLLTSDRPLWVSTGLKKPNCLMALPLSPNVIFFASNTSALRLALADAGPNRLVRRCNESLVSQAARFVYGDAEISFINRRLIRVEG